MLWEKNGDMNVVLGVDIGGSTTKIVALNEKKECIATLQVKAADQITALYGAIGNLLYRTEYHLTRFVRLSLRGSAPHRLRAEAYMIFQAVKLMSLKQSGTADL